MVPPQQEDLAWYELELDESRGEMRSTKPHRNAHKKQITMSKCKGKVKRIHHDPTYTTSSATGQGDPPPVRRSTRQAARAKVDRFGSLTSTKPTPIAHSPDLCKDNPSLQLRDLEAICLAAEKYAKTMNRTSDADADVAVSQGRRPCDARVSFSITVQERVQTAVKAMTDAVPILGNMHCHSGNPDCIQTPATLQTHMQPSSMMWEDPKGLEEGNFAACTPFQRHARPVSCFAPPGMCDCNKRQRIVGPEEIQEQADNRGFGPVYTAPGADLNILRPMRESTDSNVNDWMRVGDAAPEDYTKTLGLACGSGSGSGSIPSPLKRSAAERLATASMAPFADQAVYYGHEQSLPVSGDLLDVLRAADLPDNFQPIKDEQLNPAEDSVWQDEFKLVTPLGKIDGINGLFDSGSVNSSQMGEVTVPAGATYGAQQNDYYVQTNDALGLAPAFDDDYNNYVRL